MTAYEILIDRGVTRLCHFTKFQSLTHILSSDYGVSSSSLIRQDMKNVTDKERYDGELNYVCCSVQYPNSWFLKKAMEALTTAGLHVSDYSGQPYDPGIPATPINLEDFESTDDLVVVHMLEPVILDENGNVVKTGTILLGKKSE